MSNRLVSFVPNPRTSLTMPSKGVSFRTVDEVTLRGDLFLAPPQPNGTPLIIMTQGVASHSPFPLCLTSSSTNNTNTDDAQLTLLKEHYIQSWAQRFIIAGYSTLLYDHRTWGSSDGEPRQSVNPIQQAEDYHDAVLFARSLPEINGDRIAIWGIGHSGGACMIAAGDDPYIKAVVLLMPFFSGSYDASNYPAGMMERIRHERERLVAGSQASPGYVQVWDNSVSEAEGGRSQNSAPWFSGVDVHIWCEEAV